MSRHPLFAALALVFSAPLAAADFNVTRTDDPAPDACLRGDCSLREAVMAANARAGRDRIVLGAGTFTLTRLAAGNNEDERVGSLWLRDDTDLVGAGQGFGQTHVRWSAALTADTYVFRTWNGGATPISVAWSRMKVSHGNYGYGPGCFYLAGSFSSFTFDNVIVRDCRGSFGGAISVAQSTLTLVDTTIESNHASYDGGGINLAYGATLVTSGARIRSNSADRDGGGVSFGQATLAAPSTAYWFDDGSSSVTSNAATRDGGGLRVGGDVTLVLDGGAPGASARLNFGKNRAGNAGGAIARAKRFLGNASPRLDMRRVSVTYNAASTGAGLDAVEAVAIADSEFRGNSTTDSAIVGSGAGVHLQVAQGDSTIERSSFWLNDAGAMAGGALYSNGCAPLALSNVSMHDNRATRGAAIGSHGALTLEHVTAIGNAGTYAELYQYNVPGGCGATYAVAANSLLADRCGARYSSAGGNQYGPDASACLASATDQRQASDASFGLSAATFGGAATVMGWNPDAVVRPQRNFGLAANCAADDVRGLPRAAGNCDAGAFEQQ